MYFKRIEMHGFKSFAEPVTIEFDKGVTCVVGPNGSGKSNISDAIRWVLGEQSPKMLRGGKMEDVIFAGTASRKSRGMAEVTLVIDNSTGILPIEYQEVAITRRMYRSGESEYAINNNQCRMKDIRELLMDTGIGVDGYSLIGQGKISDIISNKTDSIREIFEETAGIVSYRSKKAEAERKLDAAKTNMDRVNDIITEIEGRIGSLKEDSEKATEYVALRDRHKELEVNITVKNIEDMTGKTKILGEDLQELEKELGSFTGKRAELEEKIQGSKVKLDNFEELAKEAGDLLSEAQGEISKYTSERNVNQERLRAFEKDTLRISNEIKDLEEKIQREKDNSKELLNQKAEIDEKHRKLEEELAKEVESHSETLNKRTLLAEAIDEKKNQIFTISNEKSGWLAEKNSLVSLADNLKNSKEDLLSDQDKGSNANISIKSDLEKLANELTQIEKDKETSRGKLHDLETSKANIDTRKLEIEKALQDATVKLGQNQTRKKTIEEMESNYEGYNFGVRFIMKEHLPGIEGVVAELIKVPEGFEIALETALGATMQNVICSDDKTAKEAINRLKNNKAGRLTFLPLASIKARPPMKDSKLEAQKGFVGYGVNCASYDKKYESVMAYLLGNVVIVDNMDNAIAISKLGSKGIKYVTLEGEVINTAGAVTGGKYKNKTANLLERRSEIDKLQKELEKLARDKDSLSKEKEELNKKLEVILADMAYFTSAIREDEINKINKTNEIVILEKALKDFEDESKKWEDTLANIEEETKKAQKTIDEIGLKVSDAEKQIRTLQDELETDIENLENMGSSLSEASEAITSARIKVNTCDSEKENVDNLVEVITQSIEGYEREIANKTVTLENIALDSNAISEGLKIRDEKIAENTIIKERQEAYLAQLNADKQEISKTYYDAIAEKEELNSKTTSLQNQKYEIDVKLARQEVQLDGLKNKLWEEFEISYAQALSMKTPDFAITTAIKENRQIKNRIKELGEVNVGAIKEYAQVSERYEFLTEQRADIQKSTDELNTIIFDMDKVIREKFKESFDQVEEHFEKVFVEFFGGGHAKITLDNEDDPLNATIEITAQPPGKQLRNINLLSGGEKTMTAIALMFAVLKTKPTPCCILDEVEAALDDHNIHVFANYLKNFDNIQFTLITHQKTTMEHADVMYGVTMPERGISKVFSLRMGDELPV